MRASLDSYQTTKGHTVYVTPYWDERSPTTRYLTMRHERVIAPYRSIWDATQISQLQDSVLTLERGSRLAQCIDGLPHGGQGRPHVLGVKGIVETHDRHVFGHAQAALRESALFTRDLPRTGGREVDCGRLLIC